MSKLTEKPFLAERCYEYEMTSAQGGHYRILIGTPQAGEEPPANGYPVIYALDGDAMFQTLAEAVRLQTRKPKGYDPILVIGIAYPSKEPFDVERRCLDFTMSAEGSKLPARPDGRPWPEHGGADHFLDFIELELKPAIAEQWPIDFERQLIVGHSLGGLLVLHALFTRPQLFTHYAAGSPSVWWAEDKIFKEQEQFARTWQRDSHIRLQLTVGADELPHMVQGSERMAQAMRPLAEKGITTSMIRFEEEDHVSVLPAMLSRLPRFIGS
ncbi:alpha/beta hydrolase [Paenibacillus radicis (ex Gao et al. 2016)]|uniref:Ferri-bacillibactin esterase BesA n=1 Tax=Paenibacillus radicis (ex Gao et al. 2016) TaxID=1737354 RepID=A0A917LSU5_9BACL|nr:alpha/beta hydrolase-fold protein [Paenibacillus radicis (ex Gao et al. 2016)]GGG53386.1 ferri-bacillibactin esterase BesA [Paenibacillus radicis (ex Gao et al. 2016)]